MSELPEFVRALLSPSSYPEATSQVDLIQTDISLVFITDDFAYKIKKPIRYDYLDFSTLEKRRYYCEREVVLNRRLCPDIYLGVESIKYSPTGIHIGGDGETVEYAVKMVRLPASGMMDVMLREGRVTPEMVVRIADRLAEFHRSAATGPGVNVYGSLETIKKNTAENFKETEKYTGETISLAEYRRIKDGTEAFIKSNAPLFVKRIEEGRIRDGHGDLHARNICITDGICIYDCIEFNDRFRCGDVASEVAFLAMDLDHYGRADLSRIFVNAYITASGDKELLKLLDFYKCYRAYVRGKVESFELDDPLISKEEKVEIRDTARGYFDLAASSTMPGPWLIITVGLTGTGKSTIAQALASRLGLNVISSDEVRKKLAGIPPSEHRYASFGGGIYSTEFTRLTYDTMFEYAGDILKAGGKVILDASFIQRVERENARKLAASRGARFFSIEVTLDEEEVQKRLLRRQLEGAISDGRWEIYRAQKGILQDINKEEAESHVIINNTKTANVSVNEILEKLFSF